MKAQDIEEIAQVADQAITNAIKTQFAESFSKINKKQSVNFNTGLIALIVAAFVVILGFVYFSGQTNNKIDSIGADISALDERISATDDSVIAIAGAVAQVADAVTDMQTSVNNIQTSVNNVTEQVKTVKEEVTAVKNKADNIAYLLTKANAQQMKRYAKCINNNQDLELQEQINKCKNLLK